MKLFVILVVAACLTTTLAQQQRQARRQQYRTNDQQFQRNSQQNYNTQQQQPNSDQEYNNDQQNNNSDQQNNNDQQYNRNTNNNQQYNVPKQPEVSRQASNEQYSTTAFPPIPIISFQKEQTADGSYKTSYETGNNIYAEETGFLKNVGVDDKEALVQHGSYSYTAPDGTLINVQYTADEQGFRATGDHIPTPPPVPAEIQKSLDLIYEQIRIQAIQQCAAAHRRKQRETQTLDAPTKTTGATTSTITTTMVQATTTTTKGISGNN